MIAQKMMAILRNEGIVGLLEYGRHVAFPRRSKSYANYRQLVQSGIGLEVGGPSRIFGARGNIPVYADARQVDNCNFGADTIWEGSIDAGRTFRFNRNRAPGRQYITEATDLGEIDDASYDYLISSHCIEHLANPLLGLSEWIRVVKPGGILVLVFPHKDGTFDHRRPVTTMAHLLEDRDANTGEDDMTHLAEVLELHDYDRSPGVGSPEEFRQRSLRNYENRCLHHHVFDTRLAVSVIDHMQLQIQAVELFHPFHIAITARKRDGKDPAADNSEFAVLDAGLRFS